MKNLLRGLEPFRRGVTLTLLFIFVLATLGKDLLVNIIVIANVINLFDLYLKFKH